MSSNLNGLKNYRQKLERMKAKLESGVSQAVAERGKSIAEGYYGGKATVEAVRVSETESVIEATGAGLMFREYGTGRPGEMSGYPTDRLPKDTITFQSAGKERTTKGWEYYYNNPDTKVTVNGVEGWYFGKTFMVGDSAGMEMFHTSEDLRNDLKDIVRDYLKE